MTTRRHILNFHGIGTPHDGVDASERPYWITGAMFREIVDMVLARPDGQSVGWTFDDGNASDLEVGARVLADRRLTGSFFLLTGRFGDPRYLSPEDSRTLRAMDMTVGLHGRDHVDWRRLDDPALEAETSGARANLQDVLGEPVDRVAIPFGAYNRRVMRRLRRAGFSHIYTSDGGSARSGARVQNRTSVRADMSLFHIGALLDGQGLVPRARRAASTLVRRHLL